MRIQFWLTLMGCVLAPGLMAQGVTLSAEPQIDLKKLDSERIGDWELVCPQDITKPCIMAQIGYDPEGTPLLEMRVQLLPEVREVDGRKFEAVADIITPLGVSLQHGIEMQIDSGPVYGAEYSVCFEAGCVAREALAEETVNALKAGQTAKFSIIAMALGDKRASISLKGFTRAFEKMR